jgi:Mn2+/Fe2+ NRAMP family transporter
LIGASAILLSLGGYKWLDRFMKLVMPLLTVSTFAATALALGRIEWSFGALIPTGIVQDPKAVLFIVALIGWMPSAIDISVWSSLWTVARARQQHAARNLSAALADFDAGYIATLLLALAFVLMGTGLMFGSGIAFENNAALFATQVVNLYATTLGEWCRPLVGGTAFLVMLSTTVTVIDAFPRVLAALLEQLRAAFTHQGPGAATPTPGEGTRMAYRISFAILAAGSLSILAWGMSNFTALVDMATTLSFITAPVLSFFNHRAVFGQSMPADLRPGRTMHIWSIVGIILQSAFAVYFFWIKFAPPL